MLRQIKPRNARSKRAVEKREPKLIEDPKVALFLRGTSASEVIQLALTDLHSLKKPHSVKFTKKNPIHPFEDASSLEFFSQKNDAALVVFASHSKKRPHNLTFVRMFDHHVLDMFELFLDPETFRTLAQFKNKKCAVGLKPMLHFAGTVFEDKIAGEGSYALIKNFFIDFFRGADTDAIGVEGLQYMISFAAGEPSDEEPNLKVHMRVYLTITKRSGQRLPRVEVEEMGPRMDFRIGRIKQADEDVLKEALKRPKQLEPKVKKNVGTDIVGDKMGRIHLGRQDLGKLQTRKMKGLKRGRGGDDEEGEDPIFTDDDNEETPKRLRSS